MELYEKLAYLSCILMLLAWIVYKLFFAVDKLL